MILSKLQATNKCELLCIFISCAILNWSSTHIIYISYYNQNIDYIAYTLLYTSVWVMAHRYKCSTCSFCHQVMTAIHSYENLCICRTGHGKTPKDAASVRATHPIPAACGVYYFEVKIISKGRDG